ncbi:MAG: DUF559 domain-containing protein [Stellaceae bacterium]
MRVHKRTIGARRLRRDMTEAERRLWRELRELGPPHRFRRQHPIGRYVVDFACPAAKLVIELDGGQHALRAEHDQNRSIEIASRGYRVIRFWNGDVMKILGACWRLSFENSPSPSPPPGAERVGVRWGFPERLPRPTSPSPSPRIKSVG